MVHPNMSTRWAVVLVDYLWGAVINMAPELYRGVVAQVPFVDVLTTMLDASIPLTTGEYEEWG